MNQRAVLQLLRELIAIPSVNPSLAPEEAGRGGERELALFIGDWLRKRGIPVVLQEAAPGRFNVLGLVSGRSRGKTLMLNGHLDTVGTAGMAGAPFRAAFLKGKVYGRGSADMKGGLAAMLAAADALTTRDSGFRGQLLLAFVIDEEYLSIGTEKVLEQFAADGAIVAEPTDLVIGIAHKGFAWAGVTVFGKAAHGSRPAEGVDAIVKAGKFLAEVERYEQTVLFRKKHPLLGAPSLHASRVAGGRDWSTYPDRCRIEFERRTIPGENPANLAQELRALIARVRKKDPRFRAEAKQVFARPALETERGEPLVRTLAESYRSVLGRPPRFGGISWWMDTALLAGAGIPAVAFGPQGSGLHAATEWVRLQSVLAAAAVLAESARRFCGSSHA